ncbi:MAG: metallopeptidase family protein [Nitrospirota bacterium]
MRRKEFEALVQEALERIPAEFRAALNNVAIVVESWPDQQEMADIYGDPDEVVYGLYRGTPLPERGADHVNTLPDMIVLYQGPLEQDFPARKQLIREIEITVAHEVAHHFGFGEETLEKYGYD